MKGIMLKMLKNRKKYFCKIYKKLTNCMKYLLTKAQMRRVIFVTSIQKRKFSEQCTLQKR